MFKHIFFTLQTITMTISFVALLQLKVGDEKLEDKIHNLLNHLVEEPSVKEVVLGGAQMGKDAWAAIQGEAIRRVRAARGEEPQEASRGLSSDLKESLKLKEQTDQALKAVEEAIDEQDRLGEPKAAY